MASKRTPLYYVLFGLTTAIALTVAGTVLLLVLACGGMAWFLRPQTLPSEFYPSTHQAKK